MAKTNHTESTLFERLAQIRATIELARADVVRLRASIRGRTSVDGERTPEQDLRMQLRQSLSSFDELLDELTPLEDLHFDQPLRAPLEVAHG
jgi:hypothetical protein